MKLFPRRALVALGVMAATVAAPLALSVPAAHADVTNRESYSFSNAYGEADVFVGTDANLNVYEEVITYNFVLDGNHCIDAAVDLPLDSHRPSDIFPECRSGDPGFGYDTGFLPLHWPRNSNMGAGNPVKWGDVYQNAGPTYGIRIAICDVDIVRPNADALERDSSTCAAGAAGQPGAITNLDWNQHSYLDIQNLGFGAGGADLRPEYMVGDTDTVLVGKQLGDGDLAVSWDEGHRVKHQISDGNLVVYNVSNVPTWAVAPCLKPGFSIHPSDEVVMQSDGNLVIYNTSGVAQWSDANPATNACPTGSYVAGGSPRLVMQSDGNLVIYNGNTPLWSTNTYGK